MTALELKGSLFEVLGQIKEESTLYKILNFVQREAKEESQDWWFSLPLEVREEIEVAYEESEDEASLIPHDEVSKRYEKPKYNFSDLAGQLEWESDAVAEQRKLRNEW